MTRETPQDRAVLCLHGLGGTGATLALLASAIAAQGCAVAYPTLVEADRRAACAGRSDLAALSLDDLLDEARAHALRLPVGGVSPIICGHSNGACGMTIPSPGPGRQNLRGSLAMVLSMIAFSVGDVFLKLAGGALPVSHVMVVFGGFGMAVFAVICARAARPPSPAT